MKILLIEPYLTGSHRTWAEEYTRYSEHTVEILALPGRYWKWRMHGGAVTLASQYLNRNRDPDLILATDMLDLTTFLTLTRPRTSSIPVAVYFHENQISYPWSPQDRDIHLKRDRHYGFINFTTALAADAVVFNSDYHRQSFFTELPRLIKHFPDFHPLKRIQALTAKSKVLHVGLDLDSWSGSKTEPESSNRASGLPVILWNHRWEYDKNPDEFFRALDLLAEKDMAFEVVLLGECFSRKPKIFDEARRKMGDRMLHVGYVEDHNEYRRWLRRSDILPVTSNQDFFGLSVVEAAWAGCMPLLPRRLSYPELFPPRDFPEIFYEDFEHLVDKLTRLLTRPRRSLKKSIRRRIENFSWTRMAPLYDNFFASLQRTGFT